MKYKHALFLLAVLLVSTAPIFADTIPGDSKNESKGAVSAQALAEKQGLHDLYASGDCGVSGLKENGARSAIGFGTGGSHFTSSDKTLGLGAMVDSDADSGKGSVKVIDFGSNDRKFSHLGKGKSHGKGDGDTDGGGTTSGPAVAVPEPGSRLLLLVGLAGLGIFSLRRNSYMNAME